MKVSNHPASLRTTLLVALVGAVTVQGQLQCTLSAMDESSCVESTADGGDHCVWCAVTSFGFCVTESQAEAMEQQIPGIHCDRYSEDDDAVNTDDDAVDTDDSISPNDDEIPDDFWTCLGNKDAKSCVAADCTWCDSKAGFGLCMTGPTAESASKSDWFTCSSSPPASSTSTTAFEMKSPYDPTCMMTLLTPSSSSNDDDETRCLSTMDMTGNACEWCDLAGQANLCLTSEQAEMGAPLGVACSTHKNVEAVPPPQDPMDPSCALAFLQDQSKEGCLAASDQDGNPCEYCTLQGSLKLCLTPEQAEYGEAMGIECEKDTGVADPLDTSCALAFLQDQTKEGCESALDQDGRTCEWCELPNGVGNICLNVDQADMAEQLGVTCDDAMMAHQKLRGSAIE